MTAVATRRTNVTGDTPSTWHSISPLVVAILAAAGGYLVYLGFIRTGLGQSIDTAALRGGDVHHEQVTLVLSRTLEATQLAVLGVVCLVAVAVGAVRRRFDLSIGATLLVIAANLAVQQLKSHLSRPDLDGTGMPNSFPSGHTAAAASVAFVLILAFPRALRGAMGLLGAAYVTIVAVATVWAEWHRPSDTIAALFIVLACGALITWVIRLRRIGGARPSIAPARVATLPLALVAAIGTAACLFGLATVAVSERVMPDLVSGRFAFLTGVAGIVAAVAGTFYFWVRLTAGDPLPEPQQGGKS
ncbi:phosphoesterase [Actinoplanes sp. SE50]|uniref:phosphatase PAP2 family protein n=1 Tax=unclassified Actinoplanes TaxID=2626549 RepID=UPI00023ED664|nr:MULTISPECIES: phosphatase PAP2 family protein [unclassified Actinoplanes]AEV86210.1 phosphoesterase, PA-phosphatase related protein [Actinoplanes sp. SE50/110]ATO84608.1 phosphoesterase [Actinoplanes sp. SE50]SLM02018.1 phosphoesterase [Actinoplanes sp. SE50/110]